MIQYSHRHTYTRHSQSYTARGQLMFNYWEQSFSISQAYFFLSIFTRNIYACKSSKILGNIQQWHYLLEWEGLPKDCFKLWEGGGKVNIYSISIFNCIILVTNTISPDLFFIFKKFGGNWEPPGVGESTLGPLGSLIRNFWKDTTKVTKHAFWWIYWLLMTS